MSTRAIREADAQSTRYVTAALPNPSGADSTHCGNVHASPYSTISSLRASASSANHIS